MLIIGAAIPTLIFEMVEDFRNIAGLWRGRTHGRYCRTRLYRPSDVSPIAAIDQPQRPTTWTAAIDLFVHNLERDITAAQRQAGKCDAGRLLDRNRSDLIVLR